MNPTKTTYDQLNYAFTFFNRKLFGNKLAQCLITLQSKGKYFGYAAKDRFGDKAGDFKASEIALNPRYFAHRDLRVTMSTLVHEMVHVWQYQHGKPSRNGYHNKEWAARMKDVGLYPSNTGEVGGRETGQQMTHYIVDGGAYDRAYAELLASGKIADLLAQLWDTAQKSKTPVSKAKFTCGACQQNAWAKPTAKLICGACYELDGECNEMECEEL